MLIIEDKQGQESATHVSRRRGALEKFFCVLYNTFSSLASSHGQFVVVLMLFEQLQIAAIAFFSYGSKIFEDCLFYDVFNKIADGLLIFPYFPEKQLAYFAATVVYLGFIGLLLLLVGITPFLKRCPGVNQTALQLSYFLSTLLSTVLFLPAIGIVGISLKCASSPSGTNVVFLDSSVQCFGPDHAVGVSLSVILGVFTIVIGLLYKMFIHSYPLSSPDPSSRLQSTFMVAFHFIRTAMLLIILLTDYDKSSWATGLFEAFGCMGSFIILLFYSSLYNSMVRALFRTFCGVNAWIGLVLLLRKWLDSFSGAVLGVVAFCGAILAYLLFTYDPEEMWLLSGGRTGQPLNHSREIRCLLAALRLREQVGKKSRWTDHLVITYLGTHIQQCRLQTCRPRAMYDQGLLNINTNRTEVIASLTSAINGRFKESLIRHKQSALMRLLYVGFLLTYAKNHILAWEVNEGVKMCKTSLLERVHYVLYRKKIKELVDRRTAKLAQSLEPLEMEMKQKDSEKMCKLILENGTAYGQFWDTLQDRSPFYERFVTLGFTVLKGNKTIKRIWGTLSSAKGKVPLKLLSIYLAYADRLLRDTAKANVIREYFEHPELLIQDNLILQYMGSGNCVLGASADSKQLRQIRHVNAAMCELSGYTREELKLQKVEVLLPRIFRETHKEAFVKMSSLAEVGEQIPVITKQSFLVHKSQYIIPVFIQVVAGPNYTNDYSFIAKIRRDKVASRYEAVHILADHRKVITSITGNASLLLHIDNELIRSDALDIGLFLPRIEEVPERIPTPMVMRIPLRMVTSATNLCLRPDPNQARKVFSPYAEIKVVCQWKTFKKKGGTVLGYHFEIVKSEVGEAKEEEEMIMGANGSGMEFVYDLRANAFYQSAGETCDQSKAYSELKTMFQKGKDSQPAEFPTPNTPHGIQPKQLPAFIATVYPQVKKICEQTGDYLLLNKIAALKNYGKDVAQWRIAGSSFNRVEESSKHPLFEDFDDFSEPIRSKGDKNCEDRNGALIDAALRNKGNIKKLLRSLRMPSTFTNLMLMCMFVVLVSIGTVVAMYAVFTNLFNNLSEESQIIFYQMNVFRCFSEASSLILQLIFVNEYPWINHRSIRDVMALENTYPNKSSSAELLKWTNVRLLGLVDEINNNIQFMEGSPYTSLTNQLFDSTIDFRDNTTDLTYPHMSYIMGYRLLAQEMFYMATRTSMSEYTYSNKHFAAVQYNVLNGLFAGSLSSTSQFMLNVKDLYDEQMHSTKVIVIVTTCIFVLLVFIQVPTGYALNSIVRDQIDIFLKLPSRTCAKLSRAANEFVNKIQNKRYDYDDSKLQSSASAYDNNEFTGISEDSQQQNENNNNASSGLETKVFYKSLWGQLSFAWLILLTFLIPASIMIAMYTTAFAHANLMFQVVKVTNYTVSMDMFSALSEDMYRVLFYDRRHPMYVVAYMELVMPFQNQIFYEYSDCLYNNAKNSLESFGSVNRDKLTKFLFESMGAVSSLFATDTTAKKGFLAVLGEYLWLERYMWLKYKAVNDKYVVYNTEEYIRTVSLYYEFIHPGVSYMYKIIREELNSQNDKIISSMAVETVLIVILSLGSFLLVWVPYMNRKKEELVKLRLLLSFIPAKVIGKVGALRKYFAQILFKQKD